MFTLPLYFPWIFLISGLVVVISSFFIDRSSKWKASAFVLGVGGVGLAIALWILPMFVLK
jgi:hypothetical protein